MNERIIKMVSEHEGDSFFAQVLPTAKAIEGVQDQLGVVLPEQFLNYLRKYGHTGIGGVEISGSRATWITGAPCNTEGTWA